MHQDQFFNVFLGNRGNGGAIPRDGAGRKQVHGREMMDNLGSNYLGNPLVKVPSTEQLGAGAH